MAHITIRTIISLETITAHYNDINIIKIIISFVANHYYNYNDIHKYNHNNIDRYNYKCYYNVIIC